MFVSILGDPLLPTAHCIFDQKVRTVIVRARVRIRVRVGDVVVRNAVGRNAGNLYITLFL